MKSSKISSQKSEIAAQNRETSSNPNTSGTKIAGNAKNTNTSGSNCSEGGYRSNPNTSQVK